VILTPKEVEHAWAKRDVALFILSNIVAERADDGTVAASGGICHRHGPWHIEDGTLIPLGIKYRAPGQRTRATTVSEKMENLSKEV
jgi:hypothetical protein